MDIYSAERSRDVKRSWTLTCFYTVRSRPEAQRTRSLQKCFSRIFTWFHWIRLFNDIIYYIKSPFELSDLVKSSRCSSKSLQKELRPWRLWTRPYGNILHIWVYIYHKDHIIISIIGNLSNYRYAFALYY